MAYETPNEMYTFQITGDVLRKLDSGFMSYDAINDNSIVIINTNSDDICQQLTALGYREGIYSHITIKKATHGIIDTKNETIELACYTEAN